MNSRQKPSELGTILEKVLDVGGILSRKDWARILGSPEEDIKAWCSGQEVPQPTLLAVITDVLQMSAQNSSEVAEVAKEWDRFCSTPNSDIFPKELKKFHYHENYTAITPRYYTNLPWLEAIGYKISKLSHEKSDNLIEKISALVNEAADV